VGETSEYIDGRKRNQLERSEDCGTRQKQMEKALQISRHRKVEEDD
jgi:hypothetical protein